MAITKIENVQDLREDLISMYQNLKGGKIGLREAKERNNTAGKILNSAKLELEYNVYAKSNAKIAFLETSKA